MLHTKKRPSFTIGWGNFSVDRKSQLYNIYLAFATFLLKSAKILQIYGSVFFEDLFFFFHEKIPEYCRSRLGLNEFL